MRFYAQRRPAGGADRPLNGCGRPRRSRPWSHGNHCGSQGRRALYGLLRYEGAGRDVGRYTAPSAACECRANRQFIQ